jgi:hypothetical protein
VTENAEAEITEAVVNLAMQDGCRRCNIVFETIPRVRRMIKRDCGDLGIHYSSDKLKAFWEYFKKTWIKKFKAAWWKVNGLDEDITNRTNNPLEGYNCTLNEILKKSWNAHPDIIHFISVIEEQSRENVRLISGILNHKVTGLASPC